MSAAAVVRGAPFGLVGAAESRIAAASFSPVAVVASDSSERNSKEPGKHRNMCSPRRLALLNTFVVV